MLTSITPLGERGRGHRWGLTAGFLVLGHLIGGAAFATVILGLGSMLRAVVAPSDAVVLGVVAFAAAVATVLDLSGCSFPGRRQVDERWLTAYRGWVYGLGFGVQLGFGFVTVINTFLFAALVIGGALLDPVQAFAIGIGYGAMRSLMALLNFRVRSVDDLKRLHRRLDYVDGFIRWAGAVAVGAGTIGAIAL
ncbi:MAG: hypothetical protein ACKVIY_17095, partial [Acidimicrobiales bacterium]|jgi:hypothetical protein